MMKRKKINKDIERKIELYVNGKLDNQQIEDLWADLIQDESALNYLKTVANLRQLSEISEREIRGGAARILAAENHKSSDEHGEDVSQPFRDSADRPGRKPSDQKADSNRSTWYVTAAAAVILIIGSYGLLNMGGEDTETIQPITSIELDYYRSSDGSIDRDHNEAVIREAIVLANQGHHQQAVVLIEEELNRVNDVDTRARLFINAGSILYNTSLYEEAAEQFENVVELGESDPLVRERAYWYLGNSYFQLHKLEDAREAFQDAYELNGAYSRVAQSYLRALAN